MKKRTAVLVVALALVAAAAVTGTWAYFTTQAQVRNVITTGTIQITLNDPAQNSAQDTVASLRDLMPGVAVEKAVNVTNDDADTAGAAWVRVKVETRITAADGTALDSTFPYDGQQLPAVEIDYAENGWLHVPGDDYYYYATPLDRGEQTTDLFDTLTLNRYLPNDYQSCTVDVVVTAQAVQVRNNDNGGQALTVQTLDHVSGWPKD
jgi:alternate signal-mediated exported protein